MIIKGNFPFGFNITLMESFTLYTGKVRVKLDQNQVIPSIPGLMAHKDGKGRVIFRFATFNKSEARSIKQELYRFLRSVMLQRIEKRYSVYEDNGIPEEEQELLLLEGERLELDDLPW